MKQWMCAHKKNRSKCVFKNPSIYNIKHNIIIHKLYVEVCTKVLILADKQLCVNHNFVQMGLNKDCKKAAMRSESVLNFKSVAMDEREIVTS